MEKAKKLVKSTWTEQGNLKSAKLVTLSLSIILLILSFTLILIPILIGGWIFIVVSVLFAVFEIGVIATVFHGNDSHRKMIFFATIVVFILSCVGFNIAILDFPYVVANAGIAQRRETMVIYTLLFQILLGIFLFLQFIRILALLVYNRWSTMSSSSPTLPKDNINSLEITIPTSGQV